MFLFRISALDRSKRVAQGLCALALCSTLVSQPALATNAAGIIATGEAPGLQDRLGFTPQLSTVPSGIDQSRSKFDAVGRPIPNGVVEPPTWQLSLPKDPLDGKAYTDQLLGSYPKDGTKSNIGLYVIAWRFKFANGLETDATKPSCGETTSVVSRFFASPLVNDSNYASNGVALGSREFVDAFQTAEFTGLGFPAGWRTNFVPSKTYYIVTISVPAADGTASKTSGCTNPFGYVKMSWFDPIDRYWIQHFNASHAEVPFSLFNNTVMYGTTTKDCCIIGYHSAYGTSTYSQVYGVGSYVEKGQFAGLQDVGALSHELAELTNDPYVNDPTPAWGHIGQVSGCQGNFEVGDPLSGTSFGYDLNGFAYHLQDLAFFSWFYRLTSAAGYHIGTGGKYSFRGTFTGVEGSACKS